MTLLAMLVFAAFTRQSRPSSSTLIVKFSLMYRHASLHAVHSVTVSLYKFYEYHR